MGCTDNTRDVIVSTVMTERSREDNPSHFTPALWPLLPLLVPLVIPFSFGERLLASVSRVSGHAAFPNAKDPGLLAVLGWLTAVTSQPHGFGANTK